MGGNVQVVLAQGNEDTSIEESFETVEESIEGVEESNKGQVASEQDQATDSTADQRVEVGEFREVDFPYAGSTRLSGYVSGGHSVDILVDYEPLATVPVNNTEFSYELDVPQSFKSGQFIV